MTKLGIAIGVFLLGAAIVLFGYRWHYQPNWGRTHSVSHESRNAPSGAATRSAQPQGKQTAPQPAASQPSGFQLFEAGLNIANVLVGIIGIWLMMRSGRSKS